MTSSQVAALAGTSIGTLLPAIQFSGLMDPVSSLEGGGALIGAIYPTTHFLTISSGTFPRRSASPSSVGPSCRWRRRSRC
jgi:hypothetical protein